MGIFSRNKENKGHERLPSFPKTLRGPRGPRPPPFSLESTAMVAERLREEQEREDRRKLQRRMSQREGSPIPRSPPRRAGSDLSAHDFENTRSYPLLESNWDTHRNSNSRMAIARRPVENYDVVHTPRLPRSATQQPPERRSRSSPRNDARRHSLDMDTFNMEVAMDRFGQQHVELVRLRDDVRKLRHERDSFREKLDKSHAEYLEMKDLRDNALDGKAAVEHRFEPTAKENNSLKRDNEQYKKDLQYFRGEVARLKKVIDSRNADIKKNEGKVKELDNKLKNQKSIQQDALDTQKLKMSREKEAVERQLHNANDTISQEKSKVDKLRSDKKGLEKNVKQLQDTVKACNREILELETTKKGQKDAIDFLEKELGREIVASKERNTDMRKAQESAFKMMMEPAKWMPKADADVRRSLDKLAEDLWSWTKSCVKKNLDQEQFNSEPAQRLLAHVSQMNGEQYYFSIDDPRHCMKLPALMCIASMTSTLYRTIFGNPFFWQTSTTEHKNDSNHYPGLALYQVYMDAISTDESGANEWRCQLLRTFDPYIASDDPTDSSSKPEQCRRSAAQHFVDDFLSSDIKLFLDPNAISNENRLSQLSSIITRASRIAYRLWTQKNRMVVLEKDSLIEKAEDGVAKFENNHELVQHHAYHNIELSRDDHCLDGRPIALITHPAVVAYGDSNGEHYGSYKVWKKAEVWMG